MSRVHVLVTTVTSALLGACAIEAATPCERAAATIEGCSGTVPEDFQVACEAAPDGDLVTALTSAACGDGDPGKADGLSTAAFVNACVPMVVTAYLVTRVRNPEPAPLPAEYRDRMRPVFGDLVDRIRIVWNARLIDQWEPLGFKIKFAFDIGGQAFGNEVYLKGPPTPGIDERLRIAHELQHSVQARNRGGLTGFAADYCAAFLASNFSYDENALEIDADEPINTHFSCIAFGSCD